MEIKRIELEIARWKKSIKRKIMLDGERYYRGEHDILKRKRTVIGKNGKLEEVQNLPNNKIVDNQYAKMVDQKVNYLMGKPLTFDTEDESYEKELLSIFNMRSHRLLQNVAENALNCGLGYIHPHYDEEGNFKFKRFEPYEILPFWKDAEHTVLDFVVRLYEVEDVEENQGVNYKVVEKVEIYYKDRVEKYFLDGNVLKEDKDEQDKHTYNHININNGDKCDTYAWDKVPIIPFKYNSREIPLIVKVKSLQDAINIMLSDFQNHMQEDSRNTILIIKNYDGTNLDEFRHNLATFGAVKVRSSDGSQGGVDALQIEVNSENYKSILNLLKKSLTENAMGYDGKDDKLSGNPNQMNIKSMYSDIDLDANRMETEFQASFEDLLWFVNAHLNNSGKGNFIDTKVNVIFNRDIMMNETEVIENCQKSVGILSDETIISNHPWITDVKVELKRIESQKQNDIDQYGFNNTEEIEE